MRFLLSSVSALASIACFAPWILSPRASEPSQFCFSAEYESHEAVWLSWPVYENKKGLPSTEPMLQMIEGMHGQVQVNLLVQNAAEETLVRAMAKERAVPVEHVRFFHIQHGDIWIRDMGPQFVRNEAGELRITDWSFNLWGHEEPSSAGSMLEEAVDRAVGSALQIPVTQCSEQNGRRFIHEGGSVTHNGHGTMIAVESVVMHRNMGPGRFLGGDAPIPDASSPSTYKDTLEWQKGKKLVEAEYRRMLGAKKVVWLPTGVIEDDGPYRGALAKDMRVESFDGKAIPHAGVYTMFTTNGHADEFVRFVGRNTILLAEGVVSPLRPDASDLERLAHRLETENQKRLQRAYEILSKAVDERGQPFEILRIPTPVMMFDLYQPGDDMFAYYKAYTQWEDGSSIGDAMFAVLPTSYANYFPTNQLVLLARYWKPGRSEEIKARDAAAEAVIRSAFPERKIVRIDIENVNRGGGGINCITQQQPASARFVEACASMKVKVDVAAARMFAAEKGDELLGTVNRHAGGEPIYLRRDRSASGRVHVTVDGKSPLAGKSGWIDARDVESAGEQCDECMGRF